MRFGTEIYHKHTHYILWHIDPFLGNGSVNRPATYEHATIEDRPLLGNGAVHPPVSVINSVFYGVRPETIRITKSE
jgi:hypothetical protein